MTTLILKLLFIYCFFCSVGKNVSCLPDSFYLLVKQKEFNLGDLIKRMVILSQSFNHNIHFHIAPLIVATTAFPQKFFDLYFRIPERLELFLGLIMPCI